MKKLLQFSSLLILSCLMTSHLTAGEPRQAESSAVEQDAFTAASPSSANRKRPARPPNEFASLKGRVVSASGGAVIAGASVAIGDATAQTNAEGRFEFNRLGAGVKSMTVSRIGFLPSTTSITLAVGTNPDIEISLQPAPTATLTTTSGLTYQIDVPSTEFGFVVPFAGYIKMPALKICPPSGDEVTIERSQIAVVHGPATVRPAGACCSFAQADGISVTTKDATVVDGILLDSCFGYKVDVITYDRTAQQSIFIPLREVQRIEFP